MRELLLIFKISYKQSKLYLILKTAFVNFINRFFHYKMVSKEGVPEIFSDLLKKLGVTLITDDEVPKICEIGKGGFGKVYKCLY